MAKHRTHSIAFKRQVVQEYLAAETLTHTGGLPRSLVPVVPVPPPQATTSNDAAPATGRPSPASADRAACARAGPPGRSRAMRLPDGVRPGSRRLQYARHGHSRHPVSVGIRGRRYHHRVRHDRGPPDVCPDPIDDVPRQNRHDRSRIGERFDTRPPDVGFLTVSPLEKSAASRIFQLDVGDDLAHSTALGHALKECFHDRAAGLANVASLTRWNC